MKKDLYFNISYIDLMLDNEKKSKFLANILFVIILSIAFIPLSEYGQSISNSLIKHNPIHINGNNQFSIINGVIKGKGTENDPYIIENWSINATNTHGIWIENTNAYFIINNCYIYTTSAKQNTFSGIHFNNVKNGSINNNKIEFTKYGILLQNSEKIQISDNLCNFNLEYGVILITSSFNEIINNTGSNSWYGISLLNSMSNILFKNICSSHIWYGMILVSSHKNILINNTNLENGWYGIYLNSSINNILKYNNCTNNGWNGIQLDSSSNNSIINNTSLNNGWNGLSIINSLNNRIYNNTVFNNSWYGISIIKSVNNIIDNNICSTNKYGISLENSNLNIILNNECLNNLFGIYIYHCDNNSLINNILYLNNYYGIQIEHYSNYNNILNNTINQNDNIGITISYYSCNNTFKNNFCMLNKEYGIKIIHFSNNNKVFNNYFDNSNNYYLKNCYKNLWNISKSLGKNIVSGPIMGGNYWSNYIGIDVNKDGLGETEIPYGPGDWLPLTNFNDSYSLGISDSTSTKSTTGENFNFCAIAWSTSSIKEVKVDYWFNNSIHHVYTMKKTSGNETAGTYSKDIKIPSTTLQIHYILSVIDTYDNSKSLSPRTLEVLDNDKPVISDYTSSLPTTGDNFTFEFSVADNIETSLINIEYWINEDSHKNISINSSKKYYQINITINSNALYLYYILSATDNSNNQMIIDEKVLKVIDNDGPIIKENNSITPTTGDNYTFKFEIYDNIKLKDYYLEYWFDNGLHKEVNNNSEYIIFIPPNAVELNYIIFAKDINENQAYTNNSIGIIDNDKPIILDLSQDFVTTGSEFNITTNIIDNIDISKVEIIYWYNNETFINDLNQIGNNYSSVIIIPKNITEFYYRIIAEDTSENKEILEKRLDVIDNNLPNITDFSKRFQNSFKFQIKVDDNIGVQEVKVEYNFDKGIQQMIFLQLINRTYTKEIKISENAKHIYYIIYAIDTSGNLKKSNEIEVKLKSSSNNLNVIVSFFIVLNILLSIILITCFYFYFKKPKVKENKKNNKNIGIK